ncbi:MAG: coenzyme F420-0:L-glutamate ligase [Sedimentisphaerales bacterium]|nr:coenzyme F420-0:L-glutamate ligase [Sedimentisphaerales bacterium]
MTEILSIVPNKGKKLEIEFDGQKYLRLPIKTPLLSEKTDLAETIRKYAGPYLKPGDLLFVSEKVVCVTQGRIINMNDVKPTKLARLLARRVRTGYGTANFRGFGHSTPQAMQLFIDEAGIPRVLFATAIAALTRPLGIKGAFYLICGKMAKSVDCPMSFAILEYAHYAKLAPKDPDGVARKLKAEFGNETVILDANYIGAFSLGKSTRALSEKFIGKLFRDNPLGQADEMTPICIVRKA